MLEEYLIRLADRYPPWAVGALLTAAALSFLARYRAQSPFRPHPGIWPHDVGRGRGAGRAGAVLCVYRARRAGVAGASVGHSRPAVAAERGGDGVQLGRRARRLEGNSSTDGGGSEMV